MTNPLNIIDFESMLSADQKRELLNSRIKQFAAEAYQHSLNKKTAENIQNEKQIEASTNALTILQEAIKVHQEELIKLPPTEEPVE
jgi:hypothetical protein